MQWLYFQTAVTFQTLTHPTPITQQMATLMTQKPVTLPSRSSTAEPRPESQICQSHEFTQSNHSSLIADYNEHIILGEPTLQQLEIYQLRRGHQGSWVRVHSVCQCEQNQSNSFRVFVERMPRLLQDIADISFQEGLYVLRETLQGFRELYSKFGYVRVDDKLIGVNRQGRVKVWINEDFGLNQVQLTHSPPKWMGEDLKERQMVSTIFSLCEERITKESRLSHYRKYREHKLTDFSFESALDFLGQYSWIHNIVIPDCISHKLERKCSQQEIGVFGRQNSLQVPLFFQKREGNSARKTDQNNGLAITFNLEKRRSFNQPKSCRAISKEKVVSPVRTEANPVTRPRNRSDSAMTFMSLANLKSVSNSKCGSFRKSATKYFNNQQVRTRVDSQETLTLQSSAVFKDLLSTFSNHNQMPQLQFVGGVRQDTLDVPIVNRKRKCSVVDRQTSHQNNTPEKVTIQSIGSLVRSMIVKDQPRGGRHDVNPEHNYKISVEESKCMIGDQKSSGLSFCRKLSPSPVREQLQEQETEYKTKKPFLHYKALKNSFLSKPDSQEFPPPSGPILLKNSFLNRMDLKRSEIIFERSQEEVTERANALIDSGVNNNSKCDLGLSTHVKKGLRIHVAIPDITKSSASSMCNRDTLTTNSNERRSSSFINKSFDSQLGGAWNNKSGLFKSVLLEEVANEIPEAHEGQ